MYFKKLEIFGFKSFADKTSLEFEPGVTAIVGPNGCGKSNVFDSIRWVLGEQSVKELRGGAMEDVIFNGTDKKLALGFAEVSLTFSNESRILPIDFNEVTVSRRLFRSGESEYLINKEVVRLKDVLELFMGTGVGAEAYSLVQQGKVDLVVSAKPEERRMIFDEASGITKYKAKKREALGQLKSTEENLLRLNDIILEVKRQIASLERQAKKAQRYKQEFEQLKRLEYFAAKRDLQRLSDDEQSIAIILQEGSGKEAEHLKQIAEYQNVIDFDSGTLEELEDKINEYKSQELKLENDIELNSRQIGFNQERIQSFEDQKRRLEAQKAQTLEKCQAAENKIAELKAVVAELEAEETQATARLNEQRTVLNQILQIIDEDQKAIANFEKDVFESTSRQVQIKNALTDIMKEVQGCLAKKKRLELENTKVSGEQREIQEKLYVIDRDIQSTIALIEAERRELEAEHKKWEDLSSQRISLEISINDLDKRKVFLVSQKDFIEKLQVQYHDIPDPTVEGRFLSQLPPSERHTGIIGKVNRTVKIEGERLQALTAQLSEWKESELYETFCEAKFIELDPQGISEQIQTISAREAELKVDLENLIVQIQVQAGRVENIKQSIAGQEKFLTAFETQKQSVLDHTGRLVSELNVLDDEFKHVNQELIALDQREIEAGQQLDVINRTLKDAQEAIRNKQQAIAERGTQRESISVAVAQWETEIQGFEDKKRMQQENVDHFTQSLKEDAEEAGRFDTEIAEQDVRRAKTSEEIDVLYEKIEELKRQKESLRQEFSTFEEQRNEIAQRLNSVKANIAAIHQQIESIKNELHQKQLYQQQIQFDKRAIKDRLFQAYRIDMEEEHPEFENIPAAPIAEIAADVSAEISAETTDVAVPVDKQEAIAVPDQYIWNNPEVLTAEIERLKKKCDSYGGVNLVAIEEFEELKGRFEFMTKQQSDLLTAREQLQQTISKINKQTKQLFFDTFTKVKDEFRVHFRLLFGGGEADLILLDPENVLESGIEIVARPPGKKLQSISLMSGGEKTLTAVALIFGVFKVNPSPFCVLDEIDAALDESNVGRFAQMLKEFSKIAQFIVITHNKKTIAHADIMYGITMQETGVSRVVSVKLKEQDQQPKAVGLPAPAVEIPTQEETVSAA